MVSDGERPFRMSHGWMTTCGTETKINKWLKISANEPTGATRCSGSFLLVTREKTHRNSTKITFSRHAHCPRCRRRRRRRHADTSNACNRFVAVDGRRCNGNRRTNSRDSVGETRTRENGISWFSVIYGHTVIFHVVRVNNGRRFEPAFLVDCRCPCRCR